MSEKHAIVGNDFSATMRRQDERVLATMRGTAALAAHASVGELLERMHGEATRAPTSECVVDLRELEFMNSSCFKSFVTWIGNIRKLDGAQQYKVRFSCNPTIHWQKRSLDALRCFAVDLITIEGL
jgi:hypothetical protein